jgi:glycosyltransferase involved in cell wall biosynthesis
MVTPGYYPIKGGTESMVALLSSELNKIGVATDVMTFNMNQKWIPRWSGKIEKIDCAKVFKIPALSWTFFNPSPRINMRINLIPGRFLRLMGEYDIIHFHEDEFSFPMFSITLNKPKILHLHGIDFQYYKKYALSRFLLKHVAGSYLSITRQIKQQLTELGIPKERIAYFPNTIDARVYCPSDSFPKHDNVLLYVGRITPAKGIHVLLRSLVHVATRVHLVIIGPPGDADYFQHVLSLVEAQNKSGPHRVTYLGNVDRKTLIKWYRQASIFVLPSFSEPFGIVLLEALSCGTPAVATCVDGIPEAVKDGENAVLVPARSPAKLAEAIQYLLDNEDVLRRFGLAGRKWVLDNFSLEMAIRRLCKIYRQLNWS